MRDVLFPPDRLENAVQLLGELGRDQDRDRLSDDLLGGVAVDALGPSVPGKNDPVQRLADDGVLRGLHDGRQPRDGLFAANAGTDVREEAHHPLRLADPDGALAELDREPGPILAATDTPDACIARARGQVDPGAAGRTVGREHELDGLADQLVPPVAEQRLGAPVHLLDAAVPPETTIPWTAVSKTFSMVSAVCATATAWRRRST